MYLFFWFQPWNSQFKIFWILRERLITSDCSTVSCYFFFPILYSFPLDLSFLYICKEEEIMHSFYSYICFCLRKLLYYFENVSKVVVAFNTNPTGTHIKDYKSWKRKELQIAKLINILITFITCFVSGFFKKGYKPSLPVRPTGVALDSLKHIGNVFSTTPGGDFKVHGGK